MKCSHCGTDALFGQRFSRERIPFRGERVLCPVCHAKFVHGVLRFLWFASLVFGLIGIILLIRSPNSESGFTLVNLALLQIFMVLAILPHELAHALTARCFGFLVHEVSVGRGSKVFSARILNFVVDFNSLPFGGLTKFAPVFNDKLRWKYFLIVLMGPLVNLIVAAAMYPFVSWEGISLDGSVAWLQILFVAQLVVAIENLIPWRESNSLWGLRSDGFNLIELLFSNTPSILNCPVVVYGTKDFEAV